MNGNWVLMYGIYQFLAGNYFMKRVEEDSEAVCQITGKTCVIVRNVCKCKKMGIKEGEALCHVFISLDLHYVE